MTTDDQIKETVARCRNHDSVRDAISTSIRQDRTVDVAIVGGEDEMYDAILSAYTGEWDSVDLPGGTTDAWSVDAPEGESWRLLITYE